MPWTALLAAVVAFFKALFGGKAKAPEVVEARHEATVAEKQAAIVADHTRPATVNRLSDGTF